MNENSFSYEHCYMCGDCWLRCPDGSLREVGSYVELDSIIRTESFEILCDVCSSEDAEYWGAIEDQILEFDFGFGSGCVGAGDTSSGCSDCCSRSSFLEM